MHIFSLYMSKGIPHVHRLSDIEHHILLHMYTHIPPTLLLHADFDLLNSSCLFCVPAHTRLQTHTHIHSHTHTHTHTHTHSGLSLKHSFDFSKELKCAELHDPYRT